MNLEALGFTKSTSPKHHIWTDGLIRYNPTKDSWHIIGPSRYPIPFYPKEEKDILDARRLFTK